MESEQTYQQLLVAAFEKTKKALNTRKFKDLRTAFKQAIEEAKSDNTYNADRYFPLLKQALDSKITKAVETVLIYIQKLVSQGYITGDSPDLCEHAEDPPARRHERMLIDSIVDSVCSCVQNKDENVQLLLIKTLLSIVATFNCKVHDRTLLEAFRACYHLHIISKNVVNQTTAKAALNQMLHFIFQKMESQATEASTEALSLMLDTLVRQCVDDVCIHSYKTAQGLDAPLRSVPIVLDPDDPLYKGLQPSQETNEKGIYAGKFGWCVVCRNPADLYCKDTRDPICSLDCKLLHIRNVEAADRSLNVEGISESLNDACVIFRSICKLSIKDISNPVYTLKSKILSLELILSVLDNPGPVFSARREFLSIIRSTLCESLLKNSVNGDRTLFALSLSVFIALVNNYKSSLKSEIGMFLEQVFLKILDSDNSSFLHKHLVLQVFYRITQQPRTTLEFFINFDCDVNEKDIFGRMVKSLAKIAQGRYTREETMTLQQETTLKNGALETLCNIITQQSAWLVKEMSFTGLKTESVTEEQLDETLSETSDTSLTDKFERSKQIKDTLKRAVLKFNIKPINGLRFLAQAGYLEDNNPDQIAIFLKNTEGLDKTAVGDFIGGVKPLNLKVLHAYVDLHNFSSVRFIDAFRTFLTSFRLPGEPQMADRVIERFAEKYCADNPDIFESATVAYVLGYSIMMLQTDSQNANVKRKMTLEDFIKITNGINSGKNLDADYIGEIYHTIKANPFTLEEDEVLRARLESSNSKRRQDLFVAEGEKMMARSQSFFKRGGGRRHSIFANVTDVEQLRLMFDAIWHPLLATFAIVLEEAQEAKEWGMCLTGIEACIRIAARFGMALELESFVSSLGKFTSLLHMHVPVTDKNIDCINSLLSVAKQEANYLKNSWRHVLNCISKLDYLHLIWSGAYQATPTEIETVNSELVSKSIDQAELDYIFNVSYLLDDEAIIEFVTQLVEVSKEELNSVSPRSFSLQALVYVADVNMNRIRVVWSRLWQNLKDHFSRAGLHANTSVAVLAIDSLKQLAGKFLGKEELTNFSFQKEFLAPFEEVMRNSGKTEVREILVACICHLVYMQGPSIRSGWKAIFEVFWLAAKDAHKPVVMQTVGALQKIVNKDLQFVTENLSDLIRTLLAFTGSSFEEAALGVLDLVPLCAASLKDAPKHLLFTLLSGIAPRLLDPRTSLRAKVHKVLFSILNEAELDAEQWKLLYCGVLLPVFDGAQFSDAAWIRGTCQETLLAIVKLFDVRFDSLRFLLPEFLQLLSRSVETCHESLCKVGLTVLCQFSLAVGKRLVSAEWRVLLEAISKLLEVTRPVQLASVPAEYEKLPINTQECVIRCVVQLLLISAFKDIFDAYYNLIEPSLVKSSLAVLKDSYELARNFNRDTHLRFKLWKDGFMSEMTTLPGLLKQEREGLGIYLTYMFRVFKVDASVEEPLFGICKAVLSEFVAKEQRIIVGSTLEQSEFDREVATIAPLIAQSILPELVVHPEATAKYLSSEVVDLVACESSELRLALQPLLRQLISKPDC
jgi:Sec7-like guanine-nucleotide exchange factor